MPSIATNSVFFDAWKIMEEPTQIMLDLETLGTCAPAPIVEIALLPFKLQYHKEADVVQLCLPKGYEQGVFYPSVKHQVRRGSPLDLECVSWWLGQSEEARLHLQRTLNNEEKEALALYFPIKGMRDWLTKHGVRPNDEHSCKVWAKPAAFDFPLLDSFCNLAHDTAPLWHHRAKSCLRTYVQDKPAPPMVMQQAWREGLVQHQAMSDCLAQAHDLAYAWGTTRGN